MRWDPSEYGSEDAVKKQREFFRKLAIKEDFDYLFFMGADTIPPLDVIEKLLKTAQANDIKIIGGVYWGRHGAENGNTGNAVAWIHDMSQEDQSKLFKQDNSIIITDGQGMDCVLIHREVYQNISWLSWPQNDDDYPFYDKAKELGYKNYVDTSVQCLHFYNTDSYSYRGENFAAEEKK